jgi:glycosyltransferase involved in cell wall biosynthesis
MIDQTECLLSILIPTLDARTSLCEKLCSELERQVTQTNNRDAVEILVLRDDGIAAVGAKRNELISQARGRFIVFVDDDDSISGDYVGRIAQIIRENPGADCISFAGEITFRGKHPQKMIHSIRHRDWHYRKGQYLRPPCHITPIRREIAAGYPFAEVDYAEDMDWTLRMSRDQALKHEVPVDEVLYFYNSRRLYALQWLLNLTQPLRHVLGLRFANGKTPRKNPACRNR